MIRINLLPHREEARKRRRQEFYTLIGLVMLLALAIAFVVHTFIANSIEQQQNKNDFLKREIAVLDNDIAEIKRLREQTQALLSRKRVIEELQSNRAETVHVFNELVKQTPEGVYLKSIKQTGSVINLVGYAQSNARVSQLMRNLDASPALQSPQLIEIKAADVNRRRVSEFNLNISIERQVLEDPSGKPATDASAPAAAGGKS
ncbi:PilN domain-containing protein [Uliginosibacterium sp. H1]|uniref:PilN domain-containing protein n=1 Tax=Uliginosibacterium sp. H1 TaxID=3114757 RepID=UPI002E183B3F|nr:PilN domain-containing protein [Uliginosibacterium sp. H1]